MSSDYAALLDLVARRLAEAAGDSCQIRLLSDDGKTLDVVAAYDPDPRALKAQRAFWARQTVPVESANSAAAVFRDHRPVLVPARSREEVKALCSPEAWTLIEAYVPHSIAMVPLGVAGNMLGVMGLARWRAQQVAYSEDDMTLLQDLADRASLAIFNARLLRQTSRHKDELEERVQRRTAELESANKELEAFAYSVSHDLRAPLRHISGYASILGSDSGEALDEGGRRCLGMITDSAREMGVLIDDLLQFSRISRAEMHVADVDMALTLEEALTPIREETESRAIEWSIGPLPHVDGDAALLRQVWANLVGNAVKYSRDSDPARIEVGVIDGDGDAPPANAGAEHVFFVRDNGVGFDMQYAHKLFGVFQRLHSAAEFEGTGIGLANVQRIITRHGGRVWADASADEGATFYFALPTREGQA